MWIFKNKLLKYESRYSKKFVHTLFWNLKAILKVFKHAAAAETAATTERNLLYQVEIYS